MLIKSYFPFLKATYWCLFAKMEIKSFVMLPNNININ